MRARTFGMEEGEVLEVEIVKGPSATGLCRVRRIDRPVGQWSMEFARHRDRLDPIDDEARELLGKR